ncbi:MAG TPA: Gfo/Idh/MocA family oxidoreductase, partial [bacterium]|nr:Gfo/Idh/MocA family oxidoreductase [bacterium]
VCDPDPERRRQAEERFGAAVYAEHREMLGQAAPELTVIVSRSDQHCRHACDALAAGSHVLVTKPMCLDEAQARQMLEAERASGRRLFPFLPARWGADLRRLQALVAAGAVGRVFCIRRSARGFGIRNDWQTERRYGGGYLLNWGPHLVDPPVLLAGGRPVSVFGRTRQVMNPGDVEDVFYAVLTLDNGVLVQAEYTMMAADFPSWVIQGDAGTILVRGDELVLRRTSPGSGPAAAGGYLKRLELTETQEKISGQLYGDAAEIYRDLAAALLEGKSFPVSSADGLELARWLEAIKISAAGDRVVQL